MVERDNIQRAIDIITESRRSHETWLSWYEHYPEDLEKYSATCGDIEHHQKCIDGYNHVLSVLEEFKNKCITT